MWRFHEYLRYLSRPISENQEQIIKNIEKSTKNNSTIYVQKILILDGKTRKIYFLFTTHVLPTNFLPMKEIYASNRLILEQFKSNATQ
jgi:hypothetical protein